MYLRKRMYLVRTLLRYFMMSGKGLFIGFMTLSPLILTECTDRTDIPEGSTGKPAMVNISVGTKETEGLKTRSVVDENAVSNIHVLIYDSSGNLISHGYSAGKSVTMSTVSGSGYTIYAIANTGDESLFGGTTASTIEKLKSLATPLPGRMEDIVKSGVLPMSGSLTGVTVSSDGSTQTITGLTLERMVAKVNVSVSASSDFVITGYAIKNLPSQSYYIARPNADEGSSEDLAVGDDAPFKGFNTPEVETSSIKNLTFYMYENRRGDRISIDGSEGDLTSQQQKAQYAPENATYVEVYTRCSGYTPVYRIYLGSDNCRNYNIKRNGNYTCEVNILSATQTDSRVTKIALPSNSYIVAPSAQVSIPVSRANEDGTTRIADLQAGWTTELLWTDNSGGVKADGTSSIKSVKADLEDGVIKVETGNTQGNAVVVVKVNGTVVWSWHIWVTDYDPETKSVSYNNGSKTTVFMDRNLGAVNNTAGSIGSYGLLYQWGRKDPFPGASNTTSTTSKPIYNASGTRLTEGSGGTGVKYVSAGTSSNLSGSIESPLSFYYNATSPYDWLGNTQNDNLWNGTDGGKSVYDPCPVGWRVPTSGSGSSSPWYNSSNRNYLSGSWNHGWNWTKSSYNLEWYPASGYRNYKTGKLKSTGTYGYYWSATTGGSNVYSLYFYSTSVKPDYTSNQYRANACALRCVKI